MSLSWNTLIGLTMEVKNILQHLTFFAPGPDIVVLFANTVLLLKEYEHLKTYIKIYICKSTLSSSGSRYCEEVSS